MKKMKFSFPYGDHLYEDYLIPESEQPKLEPYAGGTRFEYLFSEEEQPLQKLGLLDVTKPPFLADTTGQRDCTDALNEAIRTAQRYHFVCYFPLGTYLISDTLHAQQYIWWEDYPISGKFPTGNSTRNDIFAQTGMVQLPHGLIKFTTQSWDQGDWRSATVDYSLWWADALWNHYEYTGEIRWIRRYWPNVCKLIYALADQIDENGLLGDMPYKAFIDWALIDGVDWMKDCVLGENAFLNAQFFGVAEKMLRMAVLMGDQYMEGKLKQIRIGIRASFQERFFDIEKGCYVDANFNGRLSERVSEHSNMAAILWGLCEGDEAVAIAKKLLVDKTQPFTMAEPFGSAVTLRALDKIGLFKLAYQMLRERWGAWMVDKGLSSTPEEWGMNGSFRSGFYQGIMRSLSHAWSAEPARFLIQNTIGFQIVRPGCSEIQLCPVDIGTDYRIVCPLPQGDLTVESKDGKITCVVPDGVKLRQASLYGLSDRE